MKPTIERILDAAEDVFAQKGYEAASLGEVADKVGIRSPSLYNHFKNKEALYSAVLDRLFMKFSETLREFMDQPVSRERILEWQKKLTQLYIQNPNLARLLQHAALLGSPHTEEFIETLFKPLFELVSGGTHTQTMILSQRKDLLPWAIMGFNNLVMSYVTMAPMYQELLGVDPFSEESSLKQAEFISLLVKAVWAKEDQDNESLNP